MNKELKPGSANRSQDMKTSRKRIHTPIIHDESFADQNPNMSTQRCSTKMQGTVGERKDSDEVHASSMVMRRLVVPVAFGGTGGPVDVVAPLATHVSGIVVADSDIHAGVGEAVDGATADLGGRGPDKLRSMAIILEVASRVGKAIVGLIVGHFTVVPALGNSSGDIGDWATGSHVLHSIAVLERPVAALRALHSLRGQVIVPSQGTSRVVGTVNVVVEENHVLIVLARGEIRLLISHDVGRANTTRRSRASRSGAGVDGTGGWRRGVRWCRGRRGSIRRGRGSRGSIRRSRRGRWSVGRCRLNWSG